MQPSVENSDNELNSTILSIMNHCFPVRKVTMSSRDPYWMTPVIKILLKKRANLLARGKNTEAELLSSRLSELINRARKGSTSEAIGSRKWWKKIDQMSNRKAEADLNLNNHFPEELNDYFAKVCFDNSYVAPDPVYVSADIFSNSTKRKYLSLSPMLKEQQLVRTKFHFGYGKIMQLCLPPLSQLYGMIHYGTQSGQPPGERPTYNPYPK